MRTMRRWMLAMFSAWMALTVGTVPVAAQTAGPHVAPAGPHVPAHGTVETRSSVDMLATIEKNGKLRVGVAEIVPWAMHDKNGELIGFEIDVAKKLARDMGVAVEFHPAPLGYLIADLVAGRTDVVISGLSIEPERALRVNFSAPYNETPVTLAVNAKLAGQLSTMEALNKAEVRIGALEGSTAEEMASLLLPNARILTYTQDGAMFQDLVAGKLDAAAADSPRPEIVAKLFPSSVALPALAPLSTFPASFAVRRGDMGFVNFLNSWIVSRTENHWLEDRRTYWLKGMDWSKDL
jgi:polar amino acid transport system substrate-binding protein